MAGCHLPYWRLTGDDQLSTLSKGITWQPCPGARSAGSLRKRAWRASPERWSVHTCGKSKPAPANMGLAWQLEPGPPQIIWKDGRSTRAGCSCWVGFTPSGPGQEPLGIAILVNGFWNNDNPAILADNHGPSMLKEISAAI
jgi:hypothetical protein